MTLRFYIEPKQTDNWVSSILQYIPHESSSLDDCDYIVSTVIPYGCTDPHLIQQTLQSYKGIQKQVIVFLLSDYNEPFYIPSNVQLYRSGMYHSQRKPNEHLIPYVWVEHELQGHQDATPLPKKTINPLVGFCGSIASHPCRIQHLTQIKRHADIKTNFMLRTDHWAGKPHDPEVVQQFVKNIQQTYFTVCSRGAGNWSARFYQVLSLGRIPIVVNTDMVLPLEDIIPWKDIIVLCDTETDLAPAIRRFWHNKDIIQAQQECKRMYEEYLSPKQWCAALAAKLEKLKTNS
jgi:hypothetical protein